MRFRNFRKRYAVVGANQEFLRTIVRRNSRANSSAQCGHLATIRAPAMLSVVALLAPSGIPADRIAQKLEGRSLNSDAGEAMLVSMRVILHWRLVERRASME